LTRFDPTYFKVDERKPDLSGSTPQRIVVEVRQNQDRTALTYWYYWDHDLYRGDHVDWEPVSLIYEDDSELTEIYARVHNGLVRFAPTFEKLTIYFIAHGHTPVVRVANESTDVRFFLMNDRKDTIREKWLSLCYKRAKSNGWVTVKQPALEISSGPILDYSRWRSWGKHSVYLRI
jgi:hypothetical protein